jgi:drug/metabolite transporter (DMT)-like permease
MKTAKEVYMYLLGAVIILALVTVCSLLIFHAVPPESKDALNIALGALVVMASSVVNYFYGSSKGSADKTEFISAKDDRTRTVTDSTVKSTVEPTEKVS